MKNRRIECAKYPECLDLAAKENRNGFSCEAKYGKLNAALWGITLHHKGECFLNIEPCTKDDEDKERYSDTAYFRNGLKWAYAAKAWERVH